MSRLLLAVGILSAGACAGAPRPSPSSFAASPALTTGDPRIGLRAGWYDAGEAVMGLEVMSKSLPSASFTNRNSPGDDRFANTDLAFVGPYVIQGNYNGFQIWDISDPRRPRLRAGYVCPGPQNDVSVHGALLFLSVESRSGRIDCGTQGVSDTVSKDRVRGIRIFDISDVAHPRPLAIVQTCRGSHTHTLVNAPGDTENLYIYVSGSAGVRSPNELAGCSGAAPDKDPNTSLFRIEVVQVPLRHPELSHIVSSPRLFDSLSQPPRHPDPAPNERVNWNPGVPSPSTPPPTTGALATRQGPTQCHDITAYSAVGLAAGACAGYGFLLDIRDVVHPKRLEAVADPNFAFWHSATFSNDGGKVVFSDEWGGGSQPRCRITDRPEWGADAIFSLDSGRLRFDGYYKLPAQQSQYENCVAHNGSLIPVPGRDILVQAWYQGGISVFDWTDPLHPKEIAFYDRGPMDSTKLVDGGYWSAYWYNGYIVGSEISRGLDLFRLKPSEFLSKNEIEAAELAHFDELNVQNQPRAVWPPRLVVVRAYFDQLVRDRCISQDQALQIDKTVVSAQHLSGEQRRSQLARIASGLQTELKCSGEDTRVRSLVEAVKRLDSEP